MRKEIELGWQNGTEAIVIQGLTAGDELVLTSLGQVSSGTPVEISGKSPEKTVPKRKMSKERLAKLEKIAAEKGTTVAALIAERKAKCIQKAKASQATQPSQSAKVNH